MLYLHSFAPSKKKKVLFIHGLLGSSEDFLPIINPMSHKYHCFAIDLPGHGKSPWIDNLSKSGLIDGISTIIKNHNISYLVGYSLGGRLAMEIDTYNPALLEKLVIISSHPGLSKEDAEKKIVNIQYYQNLLDQSRVTFLRKWYDQPLFKTLSKKHMIKKRKKFDPNAVKWMLKELSLLKQPLLWSHVEKNADKYFFLCGKSDNYYKKLYSSLSQKKIILDSSHAVHLEKPHKCYQYILKHLTNSREL